MLKCNICGREAWPQSKEVRMDAWIEISEVTETEFVFLAGFIYPSPESARRDFNMIRHMPIVRDTMTDCVVDLHIGDDLVDTLSIELCHGHRLIGFGKLCDAIDSFYRDARE